MSVNDAYNIVNNASRVVSEWCHNLYHYSRVDNYSSIGVICQSQYVDTTGHLKQ
jgi:hypothetical protein